MRRSLRALGAPVVLVAAVGGVAGAAEAAGLVALAALLQAAVSGSADGALAGRAAAWFALRLAAELVEVAASSLWFAHAERSARRNLVRAALSAQWQAVAALPSGALSNALGEGILHRQQFVRAGTNLAATSATSLALLLGAVRIDGVLAACTVVLAVGVVLAVRPLARRSARAAEGFRAGLDAFADRVAGAHAVSVEARSFGVTRLLADRLRAEIGALAAMRAVIGGSVAAAAAWSAFLGQGGVLLGLALFWDGDVDAPVAVLLVLQALRFAGKLQTQAQRARDALPFVDAVDGLTERLVASVVSPAAGGPWPANGHLRWAGVVVRHGERTVLDGVDLDVAPGERVAILGSSGGGKTTLLDVALRLAAPSEGCIEPSGVQDAAWRGAVAWVPQEPTLSSGTVANAIRFHRPLSDAGVQRAASEAGLDEALARWPEGLQRDVGPGGGALSGGERQRVAVARALAGDPRVLLLDEPTSALDAAAEAEVLGWLAQAGRARAVVVVSHRDATLAFADRRLVLSEGRLRG